MQRETKAQRDERVNRILALLDEEYGTDYRCYQMCIRDSIRGEGFKAYLAPMLPNEGL